MATWLLNNQGRLAVIDLSDYAGLKYSSAVVTIAQGDGSPIVQLTNAYVNELSRAWKVNYSVAKSLTGDLYYTTFGDDNVPLSLSGLIFEPNCTTPATTAYLRMQSFFANYKATTHDPPVLDVSIDGKTHSALLVEASVSYAVGNADVKLYRFKMVFILLN